MDPETGEINIDMLAEEFKIVIDELKEDTGLSKFRKEYDLLFTALKSSNERVQEYINRFQQLKEGLLVDSYGVETALHQTENDEALKKKLLFNIDTIKKTIEDLKERDEKNQQRIELHNQNISQINQTIKNWQILNKGDLEIIERTNAIERTKSEVEYLRVKNNHSEQQIALLKDKLDRVKKSRKDVTNQLGEKTIALQVYQRKMEDQEKKKGDELRQLEQLKQDNETLNNEYAQLEEVIRFVEKNLIDLKSEKKETEKENKILQKENTILLKKELEFQKRISDVKELRDMITKNLEEREFEGSEFQNAIEELKFESLKIEKQNKIKEEKIIKLKNKVENDLDKKLLKAKAEITHLEEKYDKEISQTHQLEKEKENMIRTLNISRELLNKADISRQHFTDELNKTEKENALIASRFNILRKQEYTLINEIQTLKEENLKQIKEINMIASKYAGLEEELKEKEANIDRHSAAHSAFNMKLKQQQTLFESVKRDKLLYAKQLADAQSGIEELKRNYKSYMQNISTLKEEIDKKEEDLTKEYFRTKELEKGCEAQQKTEELLQAYLKKKAGFYADLTSKIEFLKESIDTFREQKEKIKEQLDLVISERDLISSEVIKRQKELVALKEKLKIIVFLFKNYSNAFDKKGVDLHQKKEAAKELLFEIKKLNGEVRKVPELFLDLQLLEKEFLSEKLKCNFLIQELQAPMNIHEWRKLENTNSKSFELLSKIYILTKTLISKRDELKQKEDQITEQEKKLEKIKEAIRRQPTFAEVEMLPEYEKQLKEKKKRVNKLEEEIKNARLGFSEKELEIKGFEGELKELKVRI